MAPLLRHEDFLVVFKSSKRRLPNVGELVVVNHPELGKIVKEVSSVDGDTFQVTGLSASSMSESHIGRISVAELYGKVVWTFRK